MVDVYQRVGEHFETHILISERKISLPFEELSSPHDSEIRAALDHKLNAVTFKRAWGFTVPYHREKDGVFYSQEYFRFHPGYLWSLFKIRPDVVLTTWMGSRTLMALLFGSLLGKPVLVLWQGSLHTERNIGRFKQAIRAAISRWAKHWLACGEASTEYLQSFGIPRKAIVQIQESVNDALYVRSAAPIFECGPRPAFLYAGQLTGRKGIDRLLEVAASLQREGFSFSLLIVGDGPQKDALQARCSTLDLRDVYFRPQQSQFAMAGVYRSADYFIMPTLEDIGPRAVAEALWCDLPVLCSVYAGIAHELLPAENLFDPMDLDSFAAAIKRALKGKIAPPDQTRLMSSDVIAEKIVDGLNLAIKKDHPA
jgi:glycosyltransferase involved in cell wall biosynthesis